jgi:hypothetical protein
MYSSLSPSTHLRCVTMNGVCECMDTHTHDGGLENIHSGCDICIYFLIFPSPINIAGLTTAEKPPSDPLPARTTAFSLTSISERENGSSETASPPGPGDQPTPASLDSLDGASVLVTGWQKCS